jgi:hypothetical protein
MIKTTDLIDTLLTALEADANIAAFVLAQFGADAVLKTYKGDDATDPAGENDAPYIVVATAELPYDLGTLAETRKPAVAIDWGVRNETKTASGNRVTCDGLDQVDDLGHLIVACIKTTLGNEHAAQMPYTLAESHPLYMGGLLLVADYDAGLAEPTLS